MFGEGDEKTSHESRARWPNRLFFLFRADPSSIRPDHSGQFQRDIQLMYSHQNGEPVDIPLYRRLMEDLNVDAEKFFHGNFERVFPSVV